LPGRILVVDDDPSILRLVSEYLTGRGWVVHTCETAVELEALITALRPDVVLCDLCLPDRDAVEFLLDRAACVADESIRQTPVVVMSAHELVESAVDIDMDIVAVVRKPLDLNNLRELIESVANRRQRAMKS